jgi:succinate-semialdehyde dehydrogenase/glutarate-semialdehyde dehydrogenase
MLHQRQAWVGGAASIDVTNPVDERVIASVPKLGTKETREAIEGAEKAQKLWAKKSAKERSGILRKWFNLMMENQEDLAQILTAEQGKPLTESRGEIAYGASFIEWFAEEAKRIYGETVPVPFPNGRAVVIKQPWASSPAITPWNFPNAMITRKAGPALAAGCAMVCKPRRRNPALGTGHGRTGRARRPSRWRLLGHHRFGP